MGVHVTIGFLTKRLILSTLRGRVCQSFLVLVDSVKMLLVPFPDVAFHVFVACHVLLLWLYQSVSISRMERCHYYVGRFMFDWVT
jgi:hypothetical protein